MLVLTRKKGESVDMKNRDTQQAICTVEVLEVLPGGVVRLGFRADSWVQIHRDNIRKRSKDDGSKQDSAA